MHYTYRITNTKIHKHYYGVRSSISPKSDLGLIYFSSSSDKEFIQDQKDNPQNYRYKIVGKFTTREEAIALEVKLHNKFNVGVNENFYNLSKQTMIGFDRTGKTAWNKGISRSMETKLKIGKANKGKISANKGNIYSAESREKIRIARKGTKQSEEQIKKRAEKNKGQKRTNETKSKMSEAKMGVKFSDEHKMNIKKSKQNISEETRSKLSISMKKLPKYKCTYCDMITTKPNLKRWHNENCKEKLT
ncbi:MAG: hypothetical protein KAI79_14040 [Bacteroidales bacterium]|nr:hypothetical protein [Bacteroidales bacterium]